MFNNGINIKDVNDVLDLIERIIDIIRNLFGSLLGGLLGGNTATTETASVATEE